MGATMIRAAHISPTLALLLAVGCGGGGGARTPDSGAPSADSGVTGAPADSGLIGPPADSGVLPPPDAGAPAARLSALPDAGAPADAGARDCSLNPFRCAPMQAMDAACVCLDACVGGLRWNPSTAMCEQPPAGECAVNSDCNPGAVCVNSPTNAPFAPCMGEASCRCFAECDPWVRAPMSGCPPDYDFGAGRVPVTCTWLGADPEIPEALCLPEGTGGVQGTACTDTTPCARNKNLFCAGRTANDPVGVCARLCDTTRDEAICTELGDFRCVGLADEAIPELGFCAEPPALDIGATCTSSVTCQGELCSVVLAGSCTQPCGGLSLCPPEALCISFTRGAPAGEEDICLRRCSGPDAAGDDECADRNPATICRALLTSGPALCAPPCTVGVGCPTGRTCDPASGRCR